MAWLTGTAVMLVGFTRNVTLNAALAVWVISMAIVVRPVSAWTALADALVGLVLLTAAVLRVRPSPRMPA